MIRDNRLPNPGFEVDVSDWLRSSTSVVSLTRDTTKAYAGAASGKIVTTGLGYVTSGATSVAASPGQKWHAGVRVQGLAATSYEIGILFTDGTNTLATAAAAPVTLTAGAWVLLEVSGTAPAGTTNVRVRIYDRTGNTTAWVDAGDLSRALSLVATPLPEVAGVRLEIGGAEDGALTLTRTDANGTGAVRLPASSGPVAGDLIATDFEPQLDATVSYAVTDSTGATATATASTVGGPGVALISAVRPTAYAYLDDHTGHDETADSTAQVLEPLGRAGDPIPLLAPLGRPRGSWSVLARTYADALDVRAVAEAGDVALLRQNGHPGMDTYAVIERVAIRTETAPVRWTVTVDYLATGRPTDPLEAAAGWNLGAVADTYATLDQVASAFATLRALQVGP